MRILLNEVDKDLSQNTEVLLIFRNSEKKKMLLLGDTKGMEAFYECEPLR